MLNVSEKVLDLFFDDFSKHVKDNEFCGRFIIALGWGWGCVGLLIGLLLGLGFWPLVEKMEAFHQRIIEFQAFARAVVAQPPGLQWMPPCLARRSAESTRDEHGRKTTGLANVAVAAARVVE